MSDPTYNYSGRDFTAALERLYTLLRSETPELTDLNHSDAGISLIRLLARESDQLAFYLDQAFAEGFISTARFKQSLCDLGELVGYLPTLSSAASTTLTLTRDTGNEVVSIPKYTAFARADGVTYLAADDYTIQVGVNSIDINVIEGSLVTLTLVPADFALVDLSGHYKYNLGQSVAAGTLTMVSVPEYTWTETDSFWRSLTTDRHFLLQLYADPWQGVTDTVFLVLGSIGVPGANSTVQLIRTSEAAGNCGYDKITTVPGAFSGVITCSNADPATGGAPAETTESIRAMIPAMVRTQRRGLITEDYETLLTHLAGVLHVQVIDRNASQDWPHLYVGIYVVPERGGPMSSNLRASILAECASWGHLGAWEKRYILDDAEESAVDVTVRIGLLTGYSENPVKSDVTAAITALLLPANQEIAGTLSYSTLHQTISAVTGVSWVEVDAPTNDVVAEDGQINVAGTITVTVQS